MSENSREPSEPNPDPPRVEDLLRRLGESHDLDVVLSHEIVEALARRYRRDATTVYALFRAHQLAREHGLIPETRYLERVLRNWSRQSEPNSGHTIIEHTDDTTDPIVIRDFLELLEGGLGVTPSDTMRRSSLRPAATSGPESPRSRARRISRGGRPPSQLHLPESSMAVRQALWSSGMTDVITDPAGIRRSLRPSSSLATSSETPEAKRRRLTSAAQAPSYRTYGYYGQVEPGKLELEIEYCDGGIYAEEGPVAASSRWAASNVLKDDSSVYCTKGNRCNLILKHQGGTPFDLTELTIKGPRENFTDPIREGMVFVSMDYDDLLLQTAQHQIQYTRAGEWGPTSGAAPRLRPTSIQYNPDGSAFQVLDSQGNPVHLPVSTNNAGNSETDDPQWPFRPIPPGMFDFLRTSPTSFNVTTETFSSDSESGGYYISAAARGQRRPRGLAPPRVNGSQFTVDVGTRVVAAMARDDEEEGDTSGSEVSYDSWLADPRPSYTRPEAETQTLNERASERLNNLMNSGETLNSRSWVMMGPRTMASTLRSSLSNSRFAQAAGNTTTSAPYISSGLAHAIENADEATQEAIKAIDSLSDFAGGSAFDSADKPDLLDPLASFHIERNKNKIVMKFDPPVSARYILFKMWNPGTGDKSNIDIQAIVAKGKAGTRLFPAVKMA